MLIQKNGLVIAGTVWCIASGAAAQIPGARDPLSYQDHGLYRGFNAAETASFGFHIEPFVAYQGGDFSAWNTNFQAARQSGKRIIVDLLPQASDGNGGHYGLTNLDANWTQSQIDALSGVVDEFFTQVNINDVYAITLGEEQIFWNGREAQLNALYDNIKANHDVPIYQWHSPSGSGTAPGISGWPNLKADGWVSDEYHVDTPDFERNMRAYTVLQKPIINTIWAGGDEYPGDIEFEVDKFNERVAIHEKYDVPMSSFTWRGVGGEYGWSSNAPQDLKDKFALLEQAAAAAANSGPVDFSSWDTVPWEAPAIELAFSSVGDGTATYEEDYVNDRVIRFVNDAEIYGFSDLRWDSSAVELRPRESGAASSSVAYTFESALPLSELRVNAPGFVTAGTDATISVSVVDSHGTVLQTVDGTQTGNMDLVVPGTSLAGRQFQVIYSLSGTAKSAGEVLAGIDALEVEADIHAPQAKALALRENGPAGGVDFAEDLSDMSVYHTADFNNLAKVRYSSAGLHANTLPGTLEVVQRFDSPRDFNLTEVVADGVAAYAGATFGVGVSLDGTNILAHTTSASSYGGELNLDLTSLTAPIKSKEFFVHLFLDGDYGLISSYRLNGTMDELSTDNDFGTTQQINDLVWFANASPQTYSNSLPSSVQVTPDNQDTPGSSPYDANDLDGDGQSRILYMAGLSDDKDVIGAKAFSADPFKVFDDVTVTAYAAAGYPYFATNLTGVFLSHTRDSIDQADYAATNEMQLVSVDGSTTFDGTHTVWAGARISNNTPYYVQNGWYDSRLAEFQVTTDQRDPLVGERILLSQNDMGTLRQQEVWDTSGTVSAEFYTADTAQDVGNEYLVGGVCFAGTTNAERTGDLELVLQIVAPLGIEFTDVVATADAWAYSPWGSSAQLLLSRDGVTFDVAGNIATAGLTELQVSTAGIAGYDSLSVLWVKVKMHDGFGFDINGNYLRLENFHISGQVTSIESLYTVPEPASYLTLALGICIYTSRRKRDFA